MSSKPIEALRSSLIGLIGRASNCVLRRLMLLQPAILRRCNSNTRRNLLRQLTRNHGIGSAKMADIHNEFGSNNDIQTQTLLNRLFTGLVAMERGIGRNLEAAVSIPGLDVGWKDETALILTGMLPPTARLLEFTHQRILAMQMGQYPNDTISLLETYLQTAFTVVDAAFQLKDTVHGGGNSFLSNQQEKLAFAILELAVLLESEKAIDVGRQVIARGVDPEDKFQIPGFQVREAPVSNTWTYQNEEMTWDISDGDRVLDVGSGGWPFRRATHLADMYLEETTHRVEAMQRDDRPTVCLDIHEMPFEDKTWDFVFCSHVLEHLERPGDAIRELTRVGRKGYIEVPTRLSDTMLNFTRLKDHHRWHGLALGGTLILVEWMDHERRDMGSNDFFKALMSRYHNTFQRYFEDNWDMFYAMLPWEGVVPFLIIDKYGKIIDSHDKTGDR